MRNRILAVLSFLATISVAGAASAQDTTFSLDRLRLGGAPDDGMAIWRPEIADKPRLYGQFTLAYAHNPFRIEHHIQDDAQADVMESVSGAPVQAQLNGYFDIGFEVWERLGLQVMFPVTFFQTGSPTFAPGTVPAAVDAVDLATAAPGDLRFEARGVPVIVEDGFYKLGINANVFAPSGNDLSFTGDKSASGGFGIANQLDWKDFQLVFDTGMHFRPDSSVNDFEVGHEWEYAIAGFIPIRDERIRLGLTFFGSMMVTGDEAAKVESTPIEWMIDGKFALTEDKQLYLNGFGGTRMSPGYAPDFRTGIAIGYWFNLVDVEPPAPPKDLNLNRGDIDTDKDGYPDNIDLCPTEPEDGKPPFTTDGCPGTDRDGDGIPDVLDKCPDVPEDKDGINDNDGCPEDDADKDDIPDAQDACPKEPGTASPDKEKNGCPQFIKRISGSNEIQILKKVEFEFGSARLSAASFPILDEVVKLLQANPEITLLSIEGHTDNVGSDETNLRLSKDRAKSCLDYIVQKGVKKERLTSEGFGEAKPLESNDTTQGRAKNRRTEFHIRGESTGPGGGAGGGGGPKKPTEPVPGE